MEKSMDFARCVLYYYLGWHMRGFYRFTRSFFVYTPGDSVFFFCISFFSRRASVYIRACQPFSRLVHTYRSLPEFRFSYCIQSLNMSRYFFFKNFGNKLFIGEKKKEILVDKSVVRKPIEHVKKTEHFSSLGLPRNRFLHQSSYCFYWILYVNTKKNKVLGHRLLLSPEKMSTLAKHLHKIYFCVCL